MDIKTTDALNVIAINTDATLDTIMEDIGNLPEQLMADIESQALVPAGPMIFVYSGCDGNPESQFQLSITQPVTNHAQYQGKYQASQLEPFKCVERSYHGSLHDIGPKGYEPFIAEIMQAGLQIKDECREIYTLYECQESEKNITEIQMGIV
ncbi:MAG: hypothetical protein MI976_03330 [Pseudomonadales bacterium]|nr:hypothetical protein [Pseudomonadales bacterium]